MMVQSAYRDYTLGSVTGSDHMAAVWNMCTRLPFRANPFEDTLNYTLCFRASTQNVGGLGPQSGFG